MLNPSQPALHRPHPAKLFLELTTRCSRRCKMCLHQTPGNAIAAGDFAASTFAALKPALADLEEVIIGGVGDPLLHPNLEDFIIEMKAMLPAAGTVGLQTNGTLLTRDRIDRLLSVDVDLICICVDAVDPDLLGAIGAGTRIDPLETVFGRLAQAKRRSRYAGPLVGVQLVIQQDDVHHLPQVLRWAGCLGLDFAIVSHLPPLAVELSPQAVCPPASDASTAIFFEDALTIAQSFAMDLILPARQPSHGRRCTFVEEDSVFVAWDGSLSPCHFTWHPVACYPQRRRKAVKPLFFGNIESMPLIDIWNGPAFRSFRESVLHYDYPYCGDCSLSPSDPIYAATVEDDYHPASVPCSDCLWSTGIFNCLQ